MTTPSNAVNGSALGSQGIMPAIISATRPFYWSVRRELWENRLIYIAPSAAAAVSLVSFIIHTISVRSRMHGVWPVDAARQHDALDLPLEMSAALIMGIALVVGIFGSVLIVR
jgi:ABC-2 type transport system permease protein